jgi:hypothetical protein
MKNFEKLFVLLLLGAVTILSSCKKDPIDLENSYMDIIYGSDNGLWAGDNDIRYVANLAPETLSGGTVNITYSSQADPVGFTIESVYWNTTMDWGRDVYNIQKIDRSFKTAAFTDADNAFLKVNPEGDEITITIGDDKLVETVDFEGKHEKLIVANFTRGGQDCWLGNVKYYNEDGEKPEIKLYSESHPNPITVNADPDLGENGYRPSDPEVSEPFGYAVYSGVLTYSSESSGWDNEVFVNSESDTFYVEIEGQTFSMVYDGESMYQKIMAPVN